MLLYLLPLSAGARNLLFAALLLPALAITISDVVLDALMVEAGQSLRITGWLQSICCGASYLATLLTGVWGGSLTEERQQQLGFLMCGLLTAVTLLLAVVYVREPRDCPSESGFRPATKAVRESLRSPGVLAVGLFLFAWHFNPFSQSVLYLHMTGALHFSERSYGHTVSIIAIGSIAACMFYGLCCRRVPMRWLAPVSIVSGMLSTLTYYWPMADGASAAWVSMLAGFTYMMASMVLLDLAARACPMQAAGTVFAMFMAHVQYLGRLIDLVRRLLLRGRLCRLGQRLGLRSVTGRQRRLYRALLAGRPAPAAGVAGLSGGRWPR